MKISPLSDPRVAMLAGLEASINEIIESKQRVLNLFSATKKTSDVERELLTTIDLTIGQLRALAESIRNTTYRGFEITVDEGIKHRKRSIASAGGKKRAQKYKTEKMEEAKRQIIAIYVAAGYPRGKDMFIAKEISNLRARCDLPELKDSTARGWLKGIYLKSA
jgi:hypothetical protein